MNLFKTLSVAVALTMGAAAASPQLPRHSVPPSHAPAVARRDSRAMEIPTARPARGQFQTQLKTSGYSGADQASAALVPAEVAAGAREIVGNVIYGGYKMASLSLSTYTLRTLLAGPNGEYGSAYYDGKYMVLTPDKDTYGDLRSINLTVYDASDWRQLGATTAQDNYVRAFDLDYDASTGRIYGCFNTTDNVAYFGYMTPPQSSADQLAPVKIADVDQVWYGFAINAAGEMYAVSKTGTLLKVDRQTGAATTVGETSVNTTYLCSATFDKATGALYYTPNTDSYSRLYSIDPATATATKVCDIPGYSQLVGIYLPEPEAADKAPGGVRNLKASFTGISLSGTVGFTAPSTLYDGSGASGSVNYTVTVDGEAVSTGSTTYNSPVEVPVSVDAPGRYTFGAYMTNDAGAGPKTSVQAYVGPDVPEAPTSAKLTYSKATSEMKLTWKAPSKGLNGTTLDPASLTYTVKCYPSGKTTTGISGTTYTETVEMPDALTDFYYTVSAVCGEYTSEPATSNTLTIGIVEPPYSISFKTPGDIDLCTVIDANKDYTKWEYTENYGGCVKVRYNITKVMDDWLVLPPMRLSAGKSYKVSFKAGTNDSSVKERIEVLAGTEDVAESMTIAVVPPTEIDKQFKDGGVMVEGYMVAPADGIYYIGFHGISDKDQNWLCLGDVAIAAGLNIGTPGLATDFTVTPDPAGALTADISFVTPDTDSDGKKLLSLTRMDLCRDGQLVNSFDAPAMGERLTFTDTEAANGRHVYTLQGFNASGGGMTATKEAFVGFDVPSKLAALTTAYGDNNGSVKLSWTPPATDVNGKAFADGALSYTIMRLDGEQQTEIVSDLTVTEYVVQAVPEDASQRFVQYAVFPRSQSGYGEGLPTGLLAVGAPYTLPMVESWTGKSMSHIWGYDGTGGLMMVDDDYFDDTRAQDGDNSYLLIYGDYKDDVVDLISGRIAIPANAVNPRLTFYCFAMSGCANTIEALVSTDGVNFLGLTSEVLSADSGKDAWKRVAAPLDAYRGRTVQIKFRAVRQNMKYIMLDNIRVYDQPAHDIGNVRISAPQTVEAGQPVALTVSYENMGASRADGMKVAVYRDGAVVARIDAAALEPEESGSVTCRDQTSTVLPEKLSYKAVVEFDADASPDDNASAPVTVALTYPEYPAASGLTAAFSGNDVVLNWTAPDLDKRPYLPETATFEDCEAFAGDEFGGWTSVKLDGGRNGSVEGISIPGIIPGESALPFFVFDTGIVPDSPGYGHFGAYSGTKYLAAVYNNDAAEPLDVLLISPRLCGDAQTVTFMAKSCLSLFPESLEVVYSTTGNAPADFTSGNVVLDEPAVPGEWSQISARLPEGTLYMAIRATSLDKYMLMIDDISCRMETSPRMDLTINGYNVYRDGAKVNGAPVTATSYVDVDAPAATQVYEVTVVYDLGESVPTEASVISAAVDELATGAVKVSAENSVITVTGAEGLGITVCTPDGRLMYVNGEAGSRESIAVVPGIYIVSVGRTPYKVLVK